MSARLGYSIKQKKSRSARAGLLFPVGRIHRICRKDVPGFSRMGKFAPVYLTAVLEYLTAEVLEQAGIISKMLQCDRVTPQHIRLAIREDSELDKLVPGTVFAGSGGGKMAELCSRRTSLELRGLAQEENVTPHNFTKDAAKSSQGKKKKESKLEEDTEDEEEEDYLKPADLSFRRKVHKASKGSKNKKSFREVFSLNKEDDKLNSMDRKKNGNFLKQSSVNETDESCGNICNNKRGEQDQIPVEFRELSSEQSPDRTFAEEVLIMSSAGEFSSFNLFVSNDGNNNDGSRAKQKFGVNIEEGPVDGGMKRLGLKKGKGGQSKLFFV